MSLTIGGVPFDAWLSKGSLTHENALNAEPDTLSVELVAEGEDGVPCPAPTAGADVVLTDADAAEIFGGVLETPSDKPLKLLTGWSCTAIDWRGRINNRVLNARRRNATGGQMLVWLIARYAPTFDTSLVDLGGEILGSVRFKPPMRMTDALDKLAALTGYVWDIQPDKKVIWGPPGTTLAPYGLTDTSRNFENLTVTEDRSELKNRVIVLGAKYPDPTAITEQFSGDGVTRHWPLSFRPYIQEDYLELDEGFSSFSVGAGGTWVQTDVTNPSPPAGHTGADGYLFTTTMSGGALSESGWLQVVGGDGTWGHVRLMSSDVFERGDGAKRFEWDVYMENATGDFRVGLWDPNNQSALAGEQHGFVFDSGTLKASEAGSVVATGPAYAAGAYFRLRLILDETAGAVFYYQTGANYGSRTWTTLHTSVAGSLANLTVAAAFNYDSVARVDRVRVYNRLYGVTVTVGGVEKTVGVLGLDESSGVDCEIGGQNESDHGSLSFFSDVIPAAGTRNVVITYHRARQVREGAQDNASIATAAAIEGGDGIHETWIEDLSCDTPELARVRARQELALYKDNAKTITWSTVDAGLRAGQVITANVTTRQNPVVGDFLITHVTATSLGAPNRFRYEVSASSRLKGAGSLLLELLGRGRKFDKSDLDDGSLIEEFGFAADSFGFTDSASSAAGPVGPFYYGRTMLLEENGFQLRTEEGRQLTFEEDPPPAHYGLAIYD